MSAPQSPWRSPAFVLAALAVAVVSQLYLSWFVAAEQTARAFDKLTFWTRYRDLTGWLHDDPLLAVRRILESIHAEDYNLLPVVLPAALVGWLGIDWRAFVTALHDVYALPTVVLLGAWAAGVLRRDDEPPKDRAAGRPDHLAAALPLLYLASLWTVWVPVLWGYPDVGGSLLAAAAVVVWLRGRPGEASLWRCLGVGVLLALAALFRRFFLFSSAAALVVMLAEAAWNRPPHWDAAWLRRWALRWLVVAATTAATYALLAFDHLRHVLAYSYRSAYSAYRSEPFLLGALRGIWLDFGGIHLALLGIGAICLVRSAAPEVRRAGAFLTAQAVVIVAAFATVQDFAQTHYALLYPSLVLLGGAGWALPLRHSPRRSAWRLGVGALLAANVALVFVPTAPSLPLPWIRAFSEFRSEPERRGDLPALRRLLDLLAAHSSQGDGIYVLASSPSINSQILTQSDIALDHPSPAAPRVRNTHDVDRRDGFPWAFLDARLVVVARPTQYHLAPADQRVVGALADAVESGQGIGASYRPLPERIRLDEGVEVTVWERVAPLDEEGVAALLARFHRWYPDHPGFPLQRPAGS